MLNQSFNAMAILTISLALCVVGLAQVPQSVLLGNVEEAANRVYALSHDSAEKEKSSLDELAGSQFQDLFKYSNECLSVIDKAVAAGVAESKTVSIQLQTISYSGPTPPRKQMSLTDIRALCQRMIRLTGGKMSRSDAEDAAQYIGIWLKLVQDGQLEEIQAPVASENGKEALAKLDRARAAGLSDNEQLDVGAGRTASVADAREQIAYIQREAEKIANKNKAAEDAQYEPFRKVLSGDKLSLYNSRLKIYKVYGVGGRVLKSPLDYASSPLWCDSGVDRNGVLPMWEVACWHFKGMSKVGDVATRSGTGESAPSSAYH